MVSETQLFIAGSVGVLLAIAGIRSFLVYRKESRAKRRLAELRAAGAAALPTLHPVIDPTLCLSSGSCTLACPQGDSVIALIEGRGALVDASECIGHGRCAAECPVNAIKLVFGTSERGADIPHLRDGFETNVPGLYITGELGGMGLIRNAVRQAVEGMEHLRRSIPRDQRGGRAGTQEDPVDVCVVGAGPAGMACGLFAIERGMTYRALEREPNLGGAVLHYPRGKLVTTEPVEVPLLGTVHAGVMSKELLVELWERAVHEHGLEVFGDTEVQNVQREGEAFAVDTNRGRLYARRVMLCVGRRGTPRRLGVPGEDAAHVAYALHDAEQYAGRAVLVVGGGDSAVEAACMLAKQPGTRVTLSYRGAFISRARPENRRRIEAAVAAGEITALWESAVVEILNGRARVATPTGEVSVTQDAVLVFAGGEMPTGFLARIGVHMERHFGEERALEADRSAGRIFARLDEQRRNKGLLDQHKDHREHRALWPLVLLLGAVALVAGIFLLGRGYYLSGPDAEHHPFRPSGVGGQTVGVIAVLAMGLNLLYAARKRIRAFKPFGSIQGWLSLHVATGLTAAVIVLMHSALLMRNLFATILYLSFGLLIVTGLVGRYLFGFVPHDPRGKPLTRSALQELTARLERGHGELFQALARELPLGELWNPGDPHRIGLLRLFGNVMFVWPLRYLRLRAVIARAEREIPDPVLRDEFAQYGRRMFQLRFEMDYLPRLKQLLGMWRAGHAVLAIYMLLLVAVHIAIEFWAGYRWIF